MIGFLINPVAGMGGKVGLKGTDGVVDESIKRGGEPVSPQRAEEFLRALSCKPEFLTASGDMGESILKEMGFGYTVIYEACGKTSAEDTKKACEKMLDMGARLIVFVGGDGTARDVVSVIDKKIPVIGIPSGVKMYSSCFSLNPGAGAEVLCKFMSEICGLKEVEILDIDENAYRNGIFRVKLYSYAQVPYIPELIQQSKKEHFEGDEESAKEEIAEYIADNMENDVLYIIGAGTTTAKIARKLGLEKTMLGVDAYYNGSIVGKDLDEKGILKLLEKYRKAEIIVSPIGAQGFIFGRGNQQISAEVIKKVGKEGITVIATPQKLAETPVLHIYTEDDFLDKELKGYVRVITGYGRYRMKKLE